MPTIINQPSKADKIVPMICGVIFLAFLVSLPFMIRDTNKLKAQAWQDNGCKMYDNYEPANVPAKCTAYFVDHYKPQAARIQPPEVNHE